MASSRAQEEKNLKAIRELMKQPANKQCFDCGQKGPVYANCTIGTFICTPCSGIHRELSHRVKSVSMSTFTSAEVEKLTNVGNENAAKEWHAVWNQSEYPAPDGNDVGYLRKFLTMTYAERRFCVRAADEGGSSKSKKATSPPSGKSSKRDKSSSRSEREMHDISLPQPEPLSNILGPNIPPLDVGPSSGSSGSSKSPRRSAAPKQESLIDFLDGPTTTSTSSNRSSSSSSNVLGDLMSLNVAPTNPAPAPGYGNPNGSFNPFGGAAPAPQQPAVDQQQITQLQGQVQQMQAAIMSAKQQMTAVQEQIQRGQQMLTQLTPQQREQLNALMQRYQAMNTQFAAMNQQYNAAVQRLQQMMQAAQQQQAARAPQPSLFDAFGAAPQPTTSSTSNQHFMGMSQPQQPAQQPNNSLQGLYASSAAPVGTTSVPSMYGAAPNTSSNNMFGAPAAQPAYGSGSTNNLYGNASSNSSSNLYGNTSSNSSNNLFGGSPITGYSAAPAPVASNGYGSYGNNTSHSAPNNAKGTDFHPF